MRIVRSRGCNRVRRGVRRRHSAIRASKPRVDDSQVDVASGERVSVRFDSELDEDSVTFLLVDRGGDLAGVVTLAQPGELLH